MAGLGEVPLHGNAEVLDPQVIQIIKNFGFNGQTLLPLEKTIPSPSACRRFYGAELHPVTTPFQARDPVKIRGVSREKGCAHRDGEFARARQPWEGQNLFFSEPMRDLGCDFEGFDVERDEFFLHGFLVAACQHKEERDAEFEREGLHDVFVAVGEEFAGHIRAREWVIAVRIHAGLVDHEAGAFFRDQVQSLFQKQAGLAFVAGRDPVRTIERGPS